MLNAGRDADGNPPGPALIRMREIGDWMDVNPAAIYETRAIAPYKQNRICFPRKPAKVYAICLAGPAQVTLPKTIVTSVGERMPKHRL